MAGKRGRAQKDIRKRQRKSQKKTTEQTKLEKNDKPVESELSHSSFDEPFSSALNSNYSNSEDSNSSNDSTVKLKQLLKKNLFARTLEKKSVSEKQESVLNSQSRVIVNAIEKKFDKRTCCKYCKELVLKLPRHLERFHKDEKEVREMCSLVPRDSRRLLILANIRKEGNFYYNQERLENRQGNLIVKRRSNVVQDANKFLPCPSCLGYYKNRTLYLHVRRCQGTKQTVTNRVQRTSRALLPIDKTFASELLRKKILPDLKNDYISEIIKNDRLILLFGSDLALKLCREQHLSSHIRQRMRELARLVAEIRKIEPSFDQFSDIYDAGKADIFFRALTNLAELDVSTGSYGKPSTAIKIRTSIHICSEILLAMSVPDENARIKIQQFLSVINLKFKRYCTLAKQSIDSAKWNKPTDLPSSDEIKKFSEYLDKEQVSLYKKLSRQYTYNIWNRLSKVLLVNILVFNRRRAGEAQMLKIEEFKKRHSIEKDSDLYKMLSEIEKQLSDNYSRIQIRGKLRNGVPVLISNFQIDIIQMLLKFRKRAGVAESNPYVFGRLSQSFLRSTDAVRQLSIESGVSNPEKIRSTTLRKQISTQVQVLNLKENEMDDLAGSLGHDIRVHRSYYRLPDHMIQIAKTGKLLTAAKQDEIMLNKGCTLDELNITVNEESLNQNTPNITEIDPDRTNENTPQKHERPTDNEIACKRALWPSTTEMTSPRPCTSGHVSRWNTPEKDRLRKRFKQHLNNFKVPGKIECEEAINEESPLKRRSWRDIKNWVHNTNVSMRRKQKNLKNMPLN